jgi:pseudouridine kinase
MAATEALEPPHLAPVVPLVNGAALLVADANLSPPVLAELFARAREARVPVVLDPVSVGKAERVAAALDPTHPVLLVTPNRDELAALTGRPVGTTPDVVAAARRLCSMGAKAVWVRLGPAGSLMVSRAAQDPRTVAAHPVHTVDVTGAGDAQLAGLCHRFVAGRPLEEAAAYGQALAALTVGSPATVRPDLDPTLVDRFLTGTGEVPV